MEFSKGAPNYNNCFNNKCGKYVNSCTPTAPVYSSNGVWGEGEGTATTTSDNRGTKGGTPPRWTLTAVYPGGFGGYYIHLSLSLYLYIYTYLSNRQEAWGGVLQGWGKLFFVRFDERHGLLQDLQRNA